MSSSHSISLLWCSVDEFWHVPHVSPLNQLTSCQYPMHRIIDLSVSGSASPATPSWAAPPWADPSPGHLPPGPGLFRPGVLWIQQILYNSWLVYLLDSQFEKMLYDGPQLALTYLSAFQLTENQSYATVARGILDYLRRDMTHPEGGIFSAEVW